MRRLLRSYLARTGTNSLILSRVPCCKLFQRHPLLLSLLPFSVGFRRFSFFSLTLAPGTTLPQFVRLSKFFFEDKAPYVIALEAAAKHHVFQ